MSFPGLDLPAALTAGGGELPFNNFALDNTNNKLLYANSACIACWDVSTRTVTTLWALDPTGDITGPANGGPISDYFGNMIVSDTSYDFHQFALADGAYVGPAFSAPAAIGGFLGQHISIRNSATTYIVISQVGKLYFITYDGATFSSVVNSATAYSPLLFSTHTLSPTKYWEMCSAVYPGDPHILNAYAWNGAGAPTAYNLLTALGITDVSVVYYPAEDALIYCHSQGIMKVAASAPTVLLQELTRDDDDVFGEAGAIVMARAGVATNNRMAVLLRVGAVLSYALIDVSGSMSVLRIDETINWDNSFSLSNREATYLRATNGIFMEKDLAFAHRVNFYPVPPTIGVQPAVHTYLL